MQGSVLIPSYGRSSRFGHEADRLIARRTGPEREDDLRLRWSSAWWSPPPESNRRPHPYHGTTRNRCADPCFPRSRPTVTAKVIGSLPAKLCALFQATTDRLCAGTIHARDMSPGTASPLNPGTHPTDVPLPPLSQVLQHCSPTPKPSRLDTEASGNLLIVSFTICPAHRRETPATEGRLRWPGQHPVLQPVEDLRSTLIIGRVAHDRSGSRPLPLGCQRVRPPVWEAVGEAARDLDKTAPVGLHGVDVRLRPVGAHPGEDDLHPVRRPARVEA
jgi:hypothetical protein